MVRPPAISDVTTHIIPFVDVARAGGLQHVVLLSQLGAEKIPVVPHRKIERHSKLSGIAYRFFRTSLFVQNLFTTHRDEMRDENILAVPASKARTSFVDARDFAAAGVNALTEAGHERRAYPLTGSEALDYGQVAAVLSESLGRTIA